MPVPPTFAAKLVSARMLTPSVRELVFERSDGAPMIYDAGQWVSLALPVEEMPGGELRRAYSIASAPDGSPRFEVAVTRVTGGPGSTLLHAMALGTEIPVIGPQGFFTRPAEKSGPSLFVGTGTGFTPMWSMLRHALASGETRALWVLVGNRTEEDILYRAELDALARTHSNVRAEYTLSRPADAWSGRRGYVQAHVKELWAELGTREEGTGHVYVCGLQRMVGAVRDLLRKDMGLAREQVHSERYD